MGRQLEGPGGEKGSKVVSTSQLTTTRGTLLLLLMCWEMAGSSKRGPSARRPKSWAHTFTHPKPNRIQSPKRLTQSCRRPAQERSCLFRNRSFINAIKICPIMNLPKKAHLPSQPIAAIGKTMATNGTLSFYGRLLVPRWLVQLLLLDSPAFASYQGHAILVQTIPVAGHRHRSPDHSHTML